MYRYVIYVLLYSLIIHAEKRTIDAPLCPTDFFRCDTIRCLPWAFVCNGEYNCHDRTDELNCSATSIDKNDHRCHTNDSIHCEQDTPHSTQLIEHGIHHESPHPVHICIKRSSVCDGVIDCRDALDEQCVQRNPLMTCSTDEYHCQITHRCIPKAWLCNGINDCLDPFASDELDCSMIVQCTSEEFSCHSKNQCVPSRAVCDGIEDCADKSDELPSICRFPRVCAPDEFACKSTNLCIPKSNLCDTISQCHDRSDEMSCRCPNEEYLSERFFYRCSSTNRCLPKNIECTVKRECHPTFLEDEDDSCLSFSSNNYQPCSRNNTCLEENQYCQSYLHRRCVCRTGYRMNETTGLCEDIDECRERVVCDHYCINTLGSYRCSCQEKYQLQSDKHTCVHRRSASLVEPSLYGLFNDGIYKIKLSVNLNKTFVTLTNHAYLVDYDPIENYLYFAECSVPIRPIIMSCSKTRGIFCIDLNQSNARRELIIDGRDYRSIQSFAIDWLHGNIYFVNTRFHSIDVCRLNGSFCRILLQQTLSDYLPQRLVLYPEKGLLFYTAIAKSRAQHIVRLGMDGTNFKLLFTSKIITENDHGNHLRSLLTMDRINHQLYFFNGFDKTFILNMHGEILHVQHQPTDQFHSFRVFADKIYQTYRSEIHIHPKYSLAPSVLESGFVFHPGRVVQSRIFPHEEDAGLLNALHNLYYYRYPLEMNDFLIVDPSDMKSRYIDNSKGRRCEQLCLPNAAEQSELICQCAQHYHLANDGVSCLPTCPEYFFHCPISKKCVPFYQQCDGIVDCPFGEDEHDCQAMACNSSSLIRCSNGSKCITSNDLCNNITDCVSGEDEDERVCEHFCEWPSLNTCPKKYPNYCSDVEFYCDGKCVSITHRCDDTPYCYDGADEPFDCVNVTCPKEYFKCPLSGHCLPYERVCDNVEDCPAKDRINGIIADETPQACNLVLDHLVDTAVPSLPPVHMTCESADLFRCKTSQFCINRTYVCDGDLDCADSSDEENCEDLSLAGILPVSLHKDYTCMHGYRCMQTRHELDEDNSLCISINELCDGIKQCPLGDDEHQWRCRKCYGGRRGVILPLCPGNCTDCDPTSSYCELINYLPVCQCRKGYVKMANGSCIFKDNLCHWSYGLCAHVNLSSQANDCFNKKIPTNCRCDHGYERRKFIYLENDDDSISCVLNKSQTFTVMLNRRASFYLYQDGSISAPVNPSHHVIDAVFVPAEDSWFLLYTEQRQGYSFMWQQKFHQILNSTNTATQIWSSSIFHFTLLEVDWIHRLVYGLYNDPSAAANGIEIMFANRSDYTQLTFLNRLTFSNLKTISSINVHPLQGYLYISAYYDAQHSFVYRSLLDGSNLEVFLTLSYPVLSMTLDYRHPRLYVLLSSGEIESYAIDASQPWKMSVYHFQELRPYSIDLNDDQLIVMVFNTTDPTYDEVWIEKFGKTQTEKRRKSKTPLIALYINQWKYPTVHTSNMVQQVCSDSSCPSGRVCISTPSHRPLCVTPGKMNLCGSSCHSRGICSNGQCICSNRTYIGNDCEMCRLTDQITVGCFQTSHESSPPCVCYLSQSNVRQTPYLCTIFKNNQDTIEVPCDRIIAPLNRGDCSRALFPEPSCSNRTHSLIFHLQTQSCICRETMNKRMNCFNNGLLILNDQENSSACSCPLPFAGNQCQVNRCVNYCKHEGECFVKNSQVTCRCSSGFTGRYCHIARLHRWRFWFLISISCTILLVVGLTFLRYYWKSIRLKYLFSHHRLHEHIGLEINSNNGVYTHVPTNDCAVYDRPLEDVLFDENEISPSTGINNRTDEKQPMFSNNC